MTNNPDLWEVRALPDGLILELRAGNAPALTLVQGENRVRVELTHVKVVVKRACEFLAAHYPSRPVLPIYRAVAALPWREGGVDRNRRHRLPGDGAQPQLSW